MDDDILPGTVIDLIIDTMAFPRGGGAVMGKVLFTLEPQDIERDGAEICVLTAATWDRKNDLMNDVRRALARNAHRLLKAAAALSEEQLLVLLDRGLDEAALPEAQPDPRRH